MGQTLSSGALQLSEVRNKLILWKDSNTVSFDTNRAYKSSITLNDYPVRSIIYNGWADDGVLGTNNNPNILLDGPSGTFNALNKIYGGPGNTSGGYTRVKMSDLRGKSILYGDIYHWDWITRNSFNNNNVSWV